MAGAPLRPELAALTAYQAEPPLGDAPLDANENVFGPPAAWAEKARQILAATPLNLYPDPAVAGLRARLAALHQVPPASLLFGNGSDELISLLLMAYGGGEALCLVPRPTFSMYRLCAIGQGWKVHEEDLDVSFGLTPAFVAAAKRLKPRLIFLASPNSPTGNAFDAALIDQLRGLDGTTLVMDEAYGEFGGRSLLKAAPNEEGLIVLRTFSKAWGLAGLRLGWLCAQPALVAELEKIRMPYNIDALAQGLAALAVEMAPQFMARVPELLALRRRLADGLAKLPGAVVYPSDTHFLLVKVPDAAALHAALLAAGLRVRRFSGGILEQCLRINAGTSEQLARLEAVVERLVTSKGKP